MTRAKNPRLSILLVEGKFDRRIFQDFVDELQCSIIWTYGKKRGLSIIEAVRAKALKGILLIVDSDYSAFLEGTPFDPDVAVNSYHDVECMMIHSSAFEKVLRECASEHALNTISARGSSPRDMLKDAALPFGLIRHYSLSNGLSISFDTHHFRSVAESDLTVIPAHAVREILNHNHQYLDRHQSILEHVNSWSADQHIGWEMCCGHDVIKILSIALRRCFSSRRAKANSAEELARLLRAAYNREHFVETQLYLDIKLWEKKNTPFVVLRF